MNKVFLSLVFGFAVIGAIVVFQATKTTASLVLLPSDLEESSGQTFKRIRVAGRVADSAIDYKTDPSAELKFSIVNPPTHQNEPLDPSGPVPVVYKGLRPDMFAVGRDVIIDGDFQDGVLQANRLNTQCPSKYEPASPDNPPQSG
ncbi:MAG: cytochrome c maturation protein CcmE [Deltaproteobacteria bacterium]|nr:cytochrome c maturation protein CcmE [Deltaproteobacteria bacterium]